MEVSYSVLSEMLKASCDEKNERYIKIIGFSMYDVTCCYKNKFDKDIFDELINKNKHDIEKIREKTIYILKECLNINLE